MQKPKNFSQHLRKRKTGLFLKRLQRKREKNQMDNKSLKFIRTTYDTNIFDDEDKEILFKNLRYLIDSEKNQIKKGRK